MEITQILKDATIIIITMWFMHYIVFLVVFKTVLRIFFFFTKGTHIHVHLDCLLSSLPTSCR